jgi:hypothetical protein
MKRFVACPSDFEHPSTETSDFSQVNFARFKDQLTTLSVSGKDGDWEQRAQLLTRYLALTATPSQRLTDKLDDFFSGTFIREKGDVFTSHEIDYRPAKKSPKQTEETLFPRADIQLGYVRNILTRVGAVRLASTRLSTDHHARLLMAYCAIDVPDVPDDSEEGRTILKALSALIKGWEGAVKSRSISDQVDNLRASQSFFRDHPLLIPAIDDKFLNYTEAILTTHCTTDINPMTKSASRSEFNQFFSHLSVLAMFQRASEECPSQYARTVDAARPLYRTSNRLVEFIEKNITDTNLEMDHHSKIIHISKDAIWRFLVEVHAPGRTMLGFMAYMDPSVKGTHLVLSSSSDLSTIDFLKRTCVEYRHILAANFIGVTFEDGTPLVSDLPLAVNSQDDLNSQAFNRLCKSLGCGRISHIHFAPTWSPIEYECQLLTQLQAVESLDYSNLKVMRCTHYGDVMPSVTLTLGCAVDTPVLNQLRALLLSYKDPILTQFGIDVVAPTAPSPEQNKAQVSEALSALCRQWVAENVTRVQFLIQETAMDYMVETPKAMENGNIVTHNGMACAYAKLYDTLIKRQLALRGRCEPMGLVEAWYDQAQREGTVIPYPATPEPKDKKTAIGVFDKLHAQSGPVAQALLELAPRINLETFKCAREILQKPVEQGLTPRKPPPPPQDAADIGWLQTRKNRISVKLNMHADSNGIGMGTVACSCFGCRFNKNAIAAKWAEAKGPTDSWGDESSSESTSGVACLSEHAEVGECFSTPPRSKGNSVAESFKTPPPNLEARRKAQHFHVTPGAPVKASCLDHEGLSIYSPTVVPDDQDSLRAAVFGLRQETEAINAALSRLKPDKSVLGEETTHVKKGKGTHPLSPEELELRKTKKKIAEVIAYLTQMAQVRDISLVPSESLLDP